MPKFNKLTARVFADVVNPSTSQGSYDKFLDVDKTLGLPEAKELLDLKLKYKKLVQSCSAELKVLAAIEEIIIQMRAATLSVIESELRLSLSRNYIYARSLFFRQGQEMNDIRVVVAKTNDYGDNLEDLIQDDNFRTLCKEKLLEAMNKQIESNIKNLNEVYAEYYNS